MNAKNIRQSIIALVLCAFNLATSGQTILTGKVVNSENMTPMTGVSIQSVEKGTVVISDENGEFKIGAINNSDTLTFNFIGFRSKLVPVKSMIKENLEIFMELQINELDEVLINTGYQLIPKERSTGSFSHIDNSLINRSVGSEIISHLEGVIGSLSYELPATVDEPTKKPNLRIRGLSTINGETQPLIVVDNFPYEGDIENINPNDVESISILKDAAAASIWGARAGNGVIVITTKKGKYLQRPTIGFNSNITVVKTPDLYYDRNYLPSAEAIELERILFDKGLYRKNDATVLTPVIETLMAVDDGTIDIDRANTYFDQLKNYDIRKEVGERLYRNGISQQYSFNINGGSERTRYYISSGYDKNLASLVNDSYNRVTFNTKTDFKISNNLKISSSANFSKSQDKNNGISYGKLSPTGMNSIYPYARLADESGDALPIPKNNRIVYTDRAEENGLLDWHYRPLDELYLNDNHSSLQEVRLNNALVYNITKNLQLEGRYQYQSLESNSTNHHPEDSYYARHLINRYTQSDGTRPIPLGGILEGGGSKTTTNYGRVQVSYNRLWNGRHSINSVAGAEIRQENTKGDPSYSFYGYDDNVLTNYNLIDYNFSWPILPSGKARVENKSSLGSQYVDRFVSYYANLAYTFNNRYIISSSARWDASNLFGVRFNQKGVPLWSSGLAWVLSDEPFFHVDWLQQLKLRATYGVNGNVSRTSSALPYITYTDDAVTGLQNGILRTPGNADLRWEQIKIMNLGLDFSLFHGRLNGSFEYFNKKSTDLIGEDFLDPTSGIIWTGSRYNMSNKRNYANMKTNGFDVELNSLNIHSRIKWNTTVLLSYSNDKITKYLTQNNPSINSFLSPTNVPVVEGKPKDALYTIPWHGLDNTGSPLVMVNGELGTDYNGYFNNLTYEDLAYEGVTVPPLFGSIRNDFYWNNFSVSFNILFKANYYFKRGGINYSSLFSSGLMHMDYIDRWKKPGDEFVTNVPSMPEASLTRRDQAYIFSDALLGKGDHIRLQDINLAYSLSPSVKNKIGASDIRLFAYAKNIGIIWRHNKYHIDPGARAFYPQPLQISFGVQAKF